MFLSLFKHWMCLFSKLPLTAVVYGNDIFEYLKA